MMDKTENNNDFIFDEICELDYRWPRVQVLKKQLLANGILVSPDFIPYILPGWLAIEHSIPNIKRNLNVNGFQPKLDVTAEQDLNFKTFSNQCRPWGELNQIKPIELNNELEKWSKESMILRNISIPPDYDYRLLKAANNGSWKQINKEWPKFMAKIAAN